MPGIFGDIQQQLNDFWQGLENNQKMKLFAVVVLSTIIIVVGIYGISRPRFETLYPHLETKDMSDATKKLSELKIDYKISDDGYGLLVPGSKKNGAKLGLAEANIPKSGSTYADAVSTSSQFGVTESDKMRQHIEYKAQEVARALMENSNTIADAQVFFNIADNSGFFDDDDKSTASVKITPATELSRSQIEGIARFVANSMSGLDPKDVEVVDNNMNTLKDMDDPSTEGADRQFNLAQTKKKKLESDIKDMLSGLSDFDKIKVVANLKLDFNSEIVDAKVVEPVIDTGGIVVSESQKTEDLQNGTTGGVPGTDSNTGVTSYPTEGSSDGSTYSSSDIIRNYAVNEKIIQTKKALGEIDTDNSTIAVSLYYGEKAQSAPSDETVNSVAEVVSMASGLTVDKISVRSFKSVIPAAVDTSPSIMYLVQEYGLFAVSAILVILLGVAVFTGSARKIKAFDDQLLLNKPKKPEISIEEIELEEKSEVKKQIDKFIKQKPDAVASLLRNWLTEDY